MTPPRLVNGRLALLFTTTFGAMTGFYLLLSVVPLYVAGGGAGRAEAGAANALLLAATVVAELATPALTARFGHRNVLGAGLLLLGLPALLLPLGTSAALVGGVSFARGLGTGLVVVVGGALVPLLVPEGRRGEGLGVAGIVAAVPAVLALPLGVWLAHAVGFTPVFVVGGLAAMAGLCCLPALPGRGTGEQGGMRAGLRSPGLVRPSVMFGATAMAAGAAITFLPITAGRAAPAALLCQALAMTASRWWGGRLADRHGPSRLVAPALVVAAAGTALLGLTPLVAGALLGTGFGLAQTAIHTLMLSRVDASGYGTVSALWNLAFDAGMGVGAAALGVAAGLTGYPVAYALTAALILAALTLKGNPDAARTRDRLARRLHDRAGRRRGTADGSGRRTAA
ncbi:putative MFS family arabinose efflux permease [Actinocorallia herbida]|uniref:Putative MFS family arabinose efflux permease n=1 Tax=Actinocorallia herbida TaxID=58109 RepID=A0A3N1CNU3_9ACTN|nr:MFS transporter [Actinocorallia herbida]ROO82962.1 putative MFS family arabinose efflux permease [Actinocorallia herbida]